MKEGDSLHNMVVDTKRRSITQVAIDVFLELTGIELYPEQEEVVRYEGGEAIGGGGEGSGKSFVGMAYLIPRAMVKKTKLYWLVGAEYERVQVEFRNIVEYGIKVGLIGKKGWSKNINPGWIEFTTGARVETKSAADPTRIGEVEPDGIIVCEAGLIDHESYLRLKGRAARKAREGSWMLLTGSFNGSLGWYPDLWRAGQIPNAQGLKSFLLPSWINKKLYPGGREDVVIKRLEASMSYSRFMERHGGQPCLPSHRVVYNAKPELHARKLEIDPNIPIELTLDPGYQPGAFAVLATQTVKVGGYHNQLQVVDEIYVQGFVTEQVAQIVMKKPWWKQVAEQGVIDVAGTYHAGAMPPAAEKWAEVTRMHLRGRKIELRAGIDRLNEFLLPHPITGEPSVVVDSINCPGLCSEWGFCQSPVEEGGIWLNKTNRQGNVVGGPEDKNDHASQALIYLIIDKWGYAHRDNATRLYRTDKQGKLVPMGV